jgi:hypothetical protein
MRLFVNATYRIGAILQDIPKETEHRRFVVTIDESPVTVSFVDNRTLEATAERDVSQELYEKLSNDDPNRDSWGPTLEEEFKTFVTIPVRGFTRVHETLKYIARNYQMKETPDVIDRLWSQDGSTWRSFVVHKMYIAGRGYMPSYFDGNLHGRIERFLDKGLGGCFQDAFRHLHRAENEKDSRHAWIDATIAAELAIKEFFILYKPELTPFVLEVPSPPLQKLYGAILESFTGERSPVLKHLAKGAETRNRLLHRPNEKVSDEERNDYFGHVETAIFHLLSLLYPDDELVKDELRLSQTPVKWTAIQGPAPPPNPQRRKP